MIYSVKDDLPNGQPLRFACTIRYVTKKAVMDACVKTRDAVLALCSSKLRLWLVVGSWQLMVDCWLLIVVVGWLVGM